MREDGVLDHDIPVEVGGVRVDNGLIWGEVEEPIETPRCLA